MLQNFEIFFSGWPALLLAVYSVVWWDTYMGTDIWHCPFSHMIMLQCLFETGKFNKMRFFDIFCEALDPSSYTLNCPDDTSSTDIFPGGVFTPAKGGSIAQAIYKVRYVTTLVWWDLLVIMLMTESLWICISCYTFFHIHIRYTWADVWLCSPIHLFP